MHKLKSGSLQLYLKALSAVALEGELIGKALDKAVQARELLLVESADEGSMSVVGCRC